MGGRGPGGPRRPPAPDVSVNVGVSFGGMLGTSGNTSEIGIVVDTGGKVCVYQQRCDVNGLGAFLGAGAVIGAQKGLVSTDSTVNGGMCVMGGKGIAGDAQVLTDAGGNVSGAKGIPGTGFGYGAGGGSMVCRTEMLSCN
jgi:hypothetical protein